MQSLASCADLRITNLGFLLEGLIDFIFTLGSFVHLEFVLLYDVGKVNVTIFDTMIKGANL